MACTYSHPMHRNSTYGLSQSAGPCYSDRQQLVRKDLKPQATALQLAAGDPNGHMVLGHSWWLVTQLALTPKNMKYLKAVFSLNYCKQCYILKYVYTDVLLSSFRSILSSPGSDVNIGQRSMCQLWSHRHLEHSPLTSLGVSASPSGVLLWKKKGGSWYTIWWINPQQA